MKLIVKVVPNAKKSRIIEEAGKLKVYVMVPAVDGKANKAVSEALASHFGVKHRAVRIIRGSQSREKVVEIDKE